MINDAHALTFVGYNDSIRFDLDSSGTYEASEHGAFKVANSWGKYWPPHPPNYPDSGYCYILYSLFSDDSVFLNGKDAYICYAMEKYEPEITIKAKMTHPNRRYFYNQVGLDTIAGTDTVSATNILWPINNGKGGEHTLTGFTDPLDTLEIGIDFSYFFNDEDVENLGEVVFRPYTNSYYQNDGYLWHASMVDNRWGEIFELPLDNVPDKMGYTQGYKFTVDYDLLPFTISQDSLLVTDQIFRLSDTIKSGAILYIGDGHTNTELHLHGSTMLIEEGASLNIKSWSSLIAKSGYNKIIIKGNLILDEDVVLKAEDGASLVIEFENDTLNWTVLSDSLINITLTGYSLSTSIENCVIQGCTIESSSCEILIANNNIINSSVYLSHPQFNSSSCEISNNEIVNNSSFEGNTVITIEDYPNFLVEDNEIYYHSIRGLELFYAGWDAEEEHSIRNNIIRYTGLSGSSMEVGIHSYFSDVQIENNRISNNDYGIAGFHGSGLIIEGDSTAKDYNETQQIYNNRISQCIFSIGSFPDEFHWNIVGDTATLSDHPHIKTVRYDECWLCLS